MAQGNWRGLGRVWKHWTVKVNVRGLWLVADWLGEEAVGAGLLVAAESGVAVAESGGELAGEV